MFRPITVVFLSFVAFLAITFVAPAFAQTQVAQEKTEAKDTAQKARGASTTDENIKSQSVENDPAATPPAPPEKGGKKTRGHRCYLTVDNNTGWKIQIYVNGEYVGLVSPWGTASGYQSIKTFTLYGVALFTDGSKYTWGPRVVNCGDSYTWHLYS